MTTRVNVLEAWAGQSNLRVFGTPLVVALVITGTGLFIGDLKTVASVFVYGFLGFVILGMLHTVANIAGKAPRIRLAVSMAYLVFVYGMLITLPLYFYLNSGVLQ
jgi:hypothetical protein